MKILNSRIKLLYLLTVLGVSSIPSQASAVSLCDRVNNSTELKNCVQKNVITQDLQTIVNALSIGVSVVVVGMIIFGGIQYITAGDSPEAVSKAKQRITNALIALLVFLLTFAFLQWLIPGGIFS